ncbi:hypothetical protein BDR05DRAFT_945821 [Suillus weaverae]|nr:hypothetical protein BDR05DRAFT_945821 [Suillus weaverae]
MAVEDSQFWHALDAILPESMQYACGNLAHHLSHGSVDDILVSALENFFSIHILQWIEASCICLKRTYLLIMKWSLATAYAEQMIILYFDPDSLFPRCGPGSRSAYRFPVSELQSSLVNPGNILLDVHFTWQMTAVHMHLRQDRSLYLLLSGRDLDYLQGKGISPFRPNRLNVGPIQPRRLFCLAEADDRCRLRVLLSTLKEKPSSRPGVIMGEQFFNFRSLTAHVIVNHAATSDWNCVTPAPASNSSERGQNIFK